VHYISALRVTPLPRLIMPLNRHAPPRVNPINLLAGTTRPDGLFKAAAVRNHALGVPEDRVRVGLISPLRC
jgi:hypothetical protein